MLSVLTASLAVFNSFNLTVTESLFNNISYSKLISY